MIACSPAQHPLIPPDALGVRTHVLGIVRGNQVLYSVATSRRTEIQLVGSNGASTTVIAFNRYMDIVDADLSPDFEMIVYTERIILSDGPPTANSASSIQSNSQNIDISNSKSSIQSTKGNLSSSSSNSSLASSASSPLSTSPFSLNSFQEPLFQYESVLCHIHSFSKLKVFDDLSPIASYFLPDSEPSGRTSFLHKKDNLNYQILHIIGNKVMNFRASYRNKKVDVKHLKDGINLNNCKKWFFSQKDYTFYALLNNNAFIVYSCTEKGLRVEKYNYFYDESTILPNELALIPSTLTNHPYFRFSSGISYILKLKYENYTDYGIIEQLYQNDESQLSFVVSTIHKKFRKVVSVPRVQSDLPISFISHEKVVFAFVPNCFVAMIDFSLQHPHISIMPRSLSKSESSMFSTSIGSSNFITDLDSGKLFNCYLSLHEIPNTLNFGDRTIISILARITASLPKYISIPAIIDHLPNDISLVQYYFLNVFNFIKQTTPPTQIVLKSNIRRKSEVPQNKTSLLSFFKKSNTKNNDRRQSDDKCIYLESEGESGSGFSEGNKENKRVNLLEEIQESIFSWKSEKTPSKSNIFSVELSSIYEAKLLDIKDFPVDLIYECTQNVEKLCPVTIKHHLTANKVINCLSSSKEADFWSSRFLDEENPNSQPNSKPNSSQNSMKMKTVDLKKKRENRKKNKIEKNLINKEGIKEALTSFPLKNIDQLDMLPKTNYLCVKSV